MLLERSDTNFIEEVSPKAFFDAIVRQVYLPRTPDEQILTFDLLDEMSRAVKFYRLGCNISNAAAETSYNALK